MIKRLVVYNRKLSHVDYVQRYVDNLYADIFRAALNSQINNNNNKLFKKLLGVFS